jgi:hypothetical protein
MLDSLQLVRMPGSSIAAGSAAGWVTDFLNAAYYAHSHEDRDPADLRLAHGILATRWHREARRLGARDLPAFARAWTALRLSTEGGRGRLTGEALLEGAAELLGPWFPEAWADPGRRAHGIAFETVAERRRFVPASRLHGSALAELTPPEAPSARRQRSTYPAVELPDPGAALALLQDPARWPDIGSGGGRFTAVRPGELEGQTFEIEVVLEAIPRAPVFTRGYVTCTALWLEGDRVLGPSVRALDSLVAGDVLPPGAEPLAHVELTTHAGHFLGRALSHLVAFRTVDGRAYIRDVGEWDPLPLPLAAAYAGGGAAAQHAFWGPDDPQLSMLVQLAQVSAAGAG